MHAALIGHGSLCTKNAGKYIVCARYSYLILSKDYVLMPILNMSLKPEMSLNSHLKSWEWIAQIVGEEKRQPRIKAQGRNISFCIITKLYV